MAKPHKWTFKARFRTNAYGWKASSLATKRLREAVSEIKKVAKTDPVVAADGAVALMERLWPSLQGIDTSSGALGTAVNRTLDALIPILIDSPADRKTRGKWLERLYEAVCEDGVEYLMPVEERWGEICASADLASEWADRMLPFVRSVWSSEKHGWATGATLCLSCLLAAGRYAEIDELLNVKDDRFWHFDQFKAEALARQGRTDEAIEYALGCRRDENGYDKTVINEFCERTLLAAGRWEEAYREYGLYTGRATTNLATYRQLAKKYPKLDSQQILQDLIERCPPTGKWFAAAKDAGFLELALECANDRSADPSTLIRAARDFLDKEPAFAANVALAAIDNLLAGGGYEPTALDMLNAHRYLMAAAEEISALDWATAAVEKLVDRGTTNDRRLMLDALRGRLRMA